MRRLLLPLAALLLTTAARADDWPQWLGPQRDGVWRETGLVEKFPPGGPRVLWRYKELGGGYAGPAVADGKVYVTDRLLDAGQKNSANAFSRDRTRGKERVLCLDAASGARVWEHSYPCTYAISYPAGPRATPVVAGGRVYSLGAMGNLFCLDARTGKEVWSRDLVKDYDAPPPLWGFAAHPLLDGDQLICLVGRNPVVVAFDKDTGKEKWRALSLDSAEVGYSPPMIYTLAGRRQLIIWHPEAVCGLEPGSGKLLWSHPWKVDSNLTVPTPRLAPGDRLFLTSFYSGARLLQISGSDPPTARVVWKSEAKNTPSGRLRERPDQTDKLHSIIPTPVIQGEYIYGVCSYGELRCLSLKDGRRLWSDLTATGPYKEQERWANAFLVPQGDRFFLFNEKGDLLISRLTPKGYEEVSRAHLLDPTYPLGGGKFTSPRKVVWSHPAFANRCVFARNDKEIVCASLAE